MRIKKVDQETMLARFQAGELVLGQLVVREAELPQQFHGIYMPDARVVLSLRNDPQEFRFAVESKSRSTPETIRSAIQQVRLAAVGGDVLPLVQVPYLSPERLKELEAEQVSGVDLCGNGIIIVPNRLYVSRSGNPNAYPDSRPLSNPYRGKSALVARLLLKTPRWSSLSGLADSIAANGDLLSLSQVSKAIQALKDDLIVNKNGAVISLIDSMQLLDRLGREWRNATRQNWYPVRIPSDINWINALSAGQNLHSQKLHWAVTGESSVGRYTTFVQGGPTIVAVSNADKATKMLNAKQETVPSFADLVFVETNAAGYYFDNEVDEDGTRWASRLQTWLELQSGDARQKEAAMDLRVQLLKAISDEPHASSKLHANKDD